MKLKVLRDFIGRYWILILLLLLKFILQFMLVNPVYELHRDEFLHLNQADHLAFGFISVPPFTALVSKLIFLLGGNIFWIRFFPALFGALTIIFVWLIAEVIGGGLLSKILASTALLFSVMMRINVLYQPNSFDILVWTVVFYFFVRYIHSGKKRWFYILSLIIAAGFYNKYNIIFLLFGLIAGLGFSSQRNIFGKTEFWKALFILVLLLMPNLIWQFIHHFPVVEHMKVLKIRQLDNNTSLGFLKDQVMFFSGSLVLILSGLTAFIYYKPFKVYRFVGICFVVVISVFACLKAKNYYAIGLYPVIFAFGSVFIERLLSRKWTFIVIPALIGINLATFILTARFVYPVDSPSAIKENPVMFEKIGMLRWEDGKNHALPQDFADMNGWIEMADKALAAYKKLPEAERKNTLVFCDNYGQAGALNYYNRKKMPPAFSFNTDYIFWLPRQGRILNVLLVGERPSDMVVRMFKSVQLASKVDNEFSREKGTGIYLLKDADVNFTVWFYAEADRRIKSFDIF